jgi:hypothetical protein
LQTWAQWQALAQTAALAQLNGKISPPFFVPQILNACMILPLQSIKQKTNLVKHEVQKCGEYLDAAQNNTS